jgi:hypothetical protein
MTNEEFEQLNDKLSPDEQLVFRLLRMSYWALPKHFNTGLRRDIAEYLLERFGYEIKKEWEE